MANADHINNGPVQYVYPSSWKEVAPGAFTYSYMIANCIANNNEL
jgi:hypothetical protein